MSVYDFTVKSIDGEVVSLQEYEGKVLLIVNTASKCGFTPQYADLEKLYQQYHAQGLEVLGFPCNQFAEQEPGQSEEIKGFCQLNYGVTFPLFEKVEVRGNDAHPLFTHLTEAMPFRGLDTNIASGKMLQAFLAEKFPHYLEGDSIKWNFTKFLVERSGNVVARFEPTTEPLEMAGDIEALLRE